MSTSNMRFYHEPTFRLNTLLYAACLVLAVVLWRYMPDRYPVHFDLFGNPTGWVERSAGMWILLTAVFTFCFFLIHLLHRFLFSNPDSKLINVPYKEQFQKLPRERKAQAMRRGSRMIGLVNTALLLCWAAIMFLTYFTAKSPGSLPARAANLALDGSMLSMLVIVVVEAVRMGRLIRRMLEEEGLRVGR